MMKKNDDTKKKLNITKQKAKTTKKIFILANLIKKANANEKKKHPFFKSKRKKNYKNYYVSNV